MHFQLDVPIDVLCLCARSFQIQLTDPRRGHDKYIAL